MLDFIRSRASGMFAKVILGIVLGLFVLGGIDTWLNQAGSNVSVAKVGDQKISIQEFGNAMESVRNRMRSSGEKIDSAMLESPLFKKSVLDGLITRKLVEAEVRDENFRISDEQLSQHILGMPEFQEKGKFSEELYSKTLQQNNLTVSKFENNIRHDLTTQQVRDGLARLVMIPKGAAESAMQYAYQERDVTTTEFKTATYLKQVNVTPEQVKAYYEQHKDKFRAPEQVRLEFALLSAAGLVSQMKADDAEVKAEYDANASKYQGNEQRAASHILIAFGAGAKAEEKAAAKAKAEDLLAQLRKNPKRFEELATKNSQDPGSAAKGGDLGSFGRGAMVKPFEDTVFTMKKNEISNVVESEFGYHIIRLNDVSGAAGSFEELKPQIKADILFRKAQAKYAELSEDFSNTVYEQSGSLQPAVKKFNLQLQNTPWMSREDGVKFFQNNTKVMTVAFSPEVLKEKRNSEAIEVAADNLISVRVLEHKPSAPRSFDEVKGGIEAVLKLEAATKLAKMDGEKALGTLKSGKAVESLEWIPTVSVNKKSAEGLSDAVMQQVFKINATKLPAYAGFVDENKAYVVVKIEAVKNQLTNDAQAKETAQTEYEAAVTAEYLAAYGKSLKAKTAIEVDRKLLESGAQ